MDETAGGGQPRGPIPAGLGETAAAPRYRQCRAMFFPSMIPPAMAVRQRAMSHVGTTAVLSLQRQGRATLKQPCPPGSRRSRMASTRAGGRPQRTTRPPCRSLDGDGEGTERRQHGGPEPTGRAGHPQATVGVDQEPRAFARGEKEQGHPLAATRVADQCREVVDVRGGGDTGSAGDGIDDGVVPRHPEERRGRSPHAQAAQQDAEDKAAGWE